MFMNLDTYTEKLSYLLAPVNGLSIWFYEQNFDLYLSDGESM